MSKRKKYRFRHCCEWRFTNTQIPSDKHDPSRLCVNNQLKWDLYPLVLLTLA